MIQLEEGKVPIDESELNKIKVLCDFLFFDQYKSSASFPRFQHAFAALAGNSKMDLFQTFKNLCGEKKKIYNIWKNVKIIFKK